MDDLRTLGTDASPGVGLSALAAPVPSWLRRAVPDAQTVEDAAIACGAAIATLDAVVRRDEKWAGAWRQRLALGAAAATVRQAGRTEDEAALRDAVLLLTDRATMPGPPAFAPRLAPASSPVRGGASDGAKPRRGIGGIRLFCPRVGFGDLTT